MRFVRQHLFEQLAYAVHSEQEVSAEAQGHSARKTQDTQTSGSADQEAKPRNWA